MMDGVCPLSRLSPKTFDHVFIFCEVVLTYWNQLSLQLHIDILQIWLKCNSCYFRLLSIIRLQQLYKFYFFMYKVILKYMQQTKQIDFICRCVCNGKTSYNTLYYFTMVTSINFIPIRLIRKTVLVNFLHFTL